MASVSFTECDPVTRRNFNEKKTVGGRVEAGGVTLRCGRNFHTDVLFYKFGEDETESSHSYPITQSTNPDVVFPQPDRDGIIKIFDNWSALTKQQIACTCPFYDLEKGCLKALELNRKSLPKPSYKPSMKKIPKVEIKPNSYTRACLLHVNEMSTDFDTTLRSYVQELKEEVENPLDYIEKEIPYLYEIFLFKKNGIDIRVVVPQTLEEIEEDLFSSLSELNEDMDLKKQNLINELGSKNEAELKEMHEMALKLGLIKPEIKSVEISTVQNNVVEEVKVEEPTIEETKPVETKQEVPEIEEVNTESKTSNDPFSLDDIDIFDGLDK